MSDLEAGLSVTFVIGGQTVPVQSKTLSVPSDKELKDAIKDAIEGGLEFCLPEGSQVTVSLADLTSWLDTKGLTLPDGFDDVVDGTEITISALTISTTGKFNIALLVDFGPGIIPGELGDLINIQELGLRLKFTPPPSS
jgi:hypothetical protein